jgi:hypothetical protein
MHPLDDSPRARVRRAVRVLLAVSALLSSLALLTGCVSPSPSPALLQFGIAGTFSDDCSRSLAEGGARAIYDVPPSGVPTFTAVNRYGTFRSKIVRADQVNADTLIMYIDDPDGTWNEVDVQREGNGFLTTRMVAHKPNAYRPVVAVGDPDAFDYRRAAADTRRGLFVQKCSDGIASGR